MRQEPLESKQPIKDKNPPALTHSSSAADSVSIPSDDAKLSECRDSFFFADSWDSFVANNGYLTRPLSPKPESDEENEPLEKSDTTKGLSVSADGNVITTPGGKKYKKRKRQTPKRGSYGCVSTFESPMKSTLLAVKEQKATRLTYRHSPFKREASIGNVVKGGYRFFCPDDAALGGHREPCSSPHLLVMRFSHGFDLDLFVSNIDLFIKEPSQALEALTQIKNQILSFVKSQFHDKGLVHCDIKANNIRVNENDCGQFKIDIIDVGSTTKLGEMPREDSVNRQYYPELCNNLGEILKPAAFEDDLQAVKLMTADLQSTIKDIFNALEEQRAFGAVHKRRKVKRRSAFTRLTFPENDCLNTSLKDGLSTAPSSTTNEPSTPQPSV